MASLPIIAVLACAAPSFLMLAAAAPDSATRAAATPDSVSSASVTSALAASALRSVPGTPPATLAPATSTPVALEADDQGRIVLVQSDGTRLVADSIEVHDGRRGTVHLRVDAGQVVMTVEDARPPTKRIGVLLEPLPEVLAAHLPLDPRDCVMVTDVEAGAAAAEAGLHRFDVLVAIDGERPATSARLREALERHDVGSAMTLRVLREQVERDVIVTVQQGAAARDDGAARLLREFLAPQPVTSASELQGRASLAPQHAGSRTMVIPSEHGRVTLFERPGPLAGLMDPTAEHWLPRDATRPVGPGSRDVLAAVLRVLERLERVEKMLEHLR